MRDDQSVSPPSWPREVRDWAPPMAWDDDTIDDPAAVPEGAGSDEHPRNRRPPVDELQFLAQSESPETIAARFGVRAAWVRETLAKASAA